MITIYHNPRCSKSREGLQIVAQSGKDFTVINYIKEPLTVNELKDLIALLGITPIDLVRKGESIWKEQFKGKTLSNDQIIQAMVDYPRLMERPVVVHGKNAIIGRPPLNIKSIL